MENRGAETIATRMFHYMHHKSSDSSRGEKKKISASHDGANGGY